MWLDGKPDIKNGLLVSGKYNAVRDDTEYYEVYNYPQLEYIGRYNASRFGNPNCIQETYPQLNSNGFMTTGEFSITRTLFPFMGDKVQYLEQIHYGYFDLVPMGDNCAIKWNYSIVDNPIPFDEIIKNILKNNKI